MSDFIERHSSFLGSSRPESMNSAISDAVEFTNIAARESATNRLAKSYSRAALESPSQHLPMGAMIPWNGPTRPRKDLLSVINEICSAPRPVALGRKAEGAEIAVKVPDSSLMIEDLGERVELDSSMMMLDPDRVMGCIAAGGSVELRQFDRHCPSWATLADDMASITGADVYVKLFLAGGTAGLNGWHRDATDVIATTVAGDKRFQIKSADESRLADVDSTVHPGDVVWIPRGWEHSVTPTGDASALISLGLMRIADWPYRGEIPKHMGFSDYPRSSIDYRLALRSHVPYSPWQSPVTDGIRFRSRIVGGYFLNGYDGKNILISANGGSYLVDAAALSVLLAIHEAGENDLASLLEATEIDAETAISILRETCKLGLASANERY